MSLPLDNLQNLYSLLNVPYLVEPVGVEPTIVHVAALPIAYSPIFQSTSTRPWLGWS